MNLLIPKASGPSRREPKRSVRPEKAVRRVKAKFEFPVPIKNRSDAAPGKLLAAALARSFSQALTHELGLKACGAGAIVTTATVTLDELAAGWTITKCHLDIVARLPKVTQGRFIDATVWAKTHCSIVRCLRANISMNARMDR